MRIDSRAARSIFLLLLLSLMGGPFIVDADAKTLYSYSDEKGNRVITDNYHTIPAAYRSRVMVIEQESDHADGYTVDVERVGKIVGSAKGFVIEFPGMSFQQSRVITYAGLIALICIVVMNLSRGEAIRMLALWCLVITGICAPVLVYIADDGAAAIMKNKAAQIQQKQQDRLSHAQQ
jgi:hypothetical protein